MRANSDGIPLGRQNRGGEGRKIARIDDEQAETGGAGRWRAAIMEVGIEGIVVQPQITAVPDEPPHAIGRGGVVIGHDGRYRTLGWRARKRTRESGHTKHDEGPAAES